MGDFFLNPGALIALASLIPVIILYLLRPKPSDIRIPSLMFIIQQRKQKRFKSILNKLVRDPLLLIQLLVLFFIAIAMAAPFYMAVASSENTVIIIDSSGSMQATDVSPSRFSQAVDIARGYITGSTTIILAENAPIVALREGGSGKANDVLDKLRPGATTSNIGDAMLLAKDIIGNGRGRVIVISDFAGEGTNPEFAGKLLGSNIEVTLRQVGRGGDNAGITGLELDESEAKFIVKNYMKTSRTMVIDVFLNDRKIDSASKEIPAGTSDFFSISNINQAGGIYKISLRQDDDLAVDNTAYISMPEQKTRRVLVLSEGHKPPAYIAASSMPQAQATLSLPFTPPVFDHDLVVLENYTASSFLPGTFDDLEAYVENGGTLVVIASDDLPFINMSLLPVTVSNMSGSSRVRVQMVNEISKDVDFGTVNAHFTAEAKNGSAVIADAEDGSPMLAFWNIGRGKVVYFGINERWGDFQFTPSYPIFWYQLLNWVSDVSPVNEYNFRTGDFLPLGSEQAVRTPTSTITTNNVLFDEAGIYTLKDREIAANMLDEQESDISALRTDIIESSGGGGWGTKMEAMRLDVYIIALVLFLVLYELYFLRRRGEL